VTDKPWLDLRDIEGVQHCHGDDCDEYYYRPVVYGDSIFTYVAHIPPGGGVSGDQGEADAFELSLYILDGEVTVTVGEGSHADVAKTYVLKPHMAMNWPKGEPYGLWNETDAPASLILSFTPPPRGAKNPKEMRELVEERGRSVASAEDMNEMAGDLLKD
jgi:glyoxylate utilization-related uncharacterized protein